MRLAAGESLRRICEPDDMPSEAAVRGWALKDLEGFAAQYARAREQQAETYAEEIVEIADTEKDAAIARNRIDARKWTASKLRPKLYGDRVEVEHSGTIKNLTDDQVDARIGELLARREGKV